MLAALCATLLALTTGLPRPAPEAEPAHRVSIRIAGPVALVEVEREVSIGEPRAVASDTVVELDLPEGAVLVDWAMRPAARAVRFAASAETTARTDYAAVLSSHHLASAQASPDEAVRVRLHLAPLAGPRRVLLHYRYTAPLACADGRFVLRLPPTSEPNPPAAHVAVSFSDLPAELRVAEASMAGVPVRVPSNGRVATVHATTPLRAAWEMSYTLREPVAAWPAQLVAVRASRRASGTARPADLLAIGVCRPQPATIHPVSGEVLLLVDRSRSVGTGGMSNQRALARALIEALPPAQRFNAILFARTATQVFPISRTATREALDAFEAAADPNQLENGTDLVAALTRAAAWVKEQGQDGSSRLLVMVSDGALPESQTGEKLAGALAPIISGDRLRLLALLVRPAADEPVPADAVQRLEKTVGRFGGAVRVLTADDLRGAAHSSLRALAQGGDLFNLRLGGREERALAAGLAPAAGLLKTLVVPKGQGSRVRMVGEYSGATVRASTPAARAAAEWLEPLVDVRPPAAWTGWSPEVAAYVETIVPQPKPPTPDGVARGQMDPLVLRNALALAFLPRARACYLSRRVSSGVDLNLRGRLRLELHLERGELEDAVVRRSTLDRPEIERCVREAAFDVEYPRPMFRDAPTVAVLNLVFRPRTPEESPPDASPGDRNIDLILGPVTFDPHQLLEEEGPVGESGAAQKRQGD